MNLTDIVGLIIANLVAFAIMVFALFLRLLTLVSVKNFRINIEMPERQLSSDALLTKHHFHHINSNIFTNSINSLLAVNNVPSMRLACIWPCRRWIHASVLWPLKGNL